MELYKIIVDGDLYKETLLQVDAFINFETIVLSKNYKKEVKIYYKGNNILSCYNIDAYRTPPEKPSNISE